VIKPTIDSYTGFDRASLTETGKRTSFQMEKSTIMRMKTVTTLDADVFVLAWEEWNLRKSKCPLRQPAAMRVMQSVTAAVSPTSNRIAT
ncbi:MAG: hypothetical protein ACKPKO_05540, partial [Candidatus Fonsibacter sp.]